MPHREPSARELFEVLIRENGDALLASIRATAGHEFADDIFQDTVLVAWRRLPDYDRTRPFGPWLRGIARMIALDYASKRARMRVASPEVMESIERDLRAFERFRGDGAEAAMDFRERMAALDDCLARLPAMYAQTVQSAYRDSHTLAQLATAFGENEETIKKRLQRARTLLESCLGGKGLFGPSGDALPGEGALA
ncbi:MAG: RNA polymerase sigma factor [Phycisphaerales bacterium]|jgi:RNA polymerase sigma-70 factor (ECF subfamily)